MKTFLRFITWHDSKSFAIFPIGFGLLLLD